MQMFVEIWSDVLCPFCYIGKRNLEAALKEFSTPVQVVWRSFELDPTSAKQQDDDLPSRLAKKYGKTREWAVSMNQQVTERAQQAGLEFHLEKAVPTNSFDAHRLIHLAEAKGLQDAMKERLLKAYFSEGKNISEPDTLVSLGVELGIDPHEIRAMLSSDQYSEAVRQDENLARDLEISGVPFFVINQRFAVSGAQPKEVFLEVFEKAKVELEKGEQ